jgi:RimJ/RimL family protein N-acetyltransferase
VANPRVENVDDRISMRLTREADRDVLLKWRNNPRVVQFTRSRVAISPEEHAGWFEKRLKNLEVEPIFIFSLDETPIGMTRLDLLDLKGKGYKISILVDELFQKAGFGKRALLQTCVFGMNALSAAYIRAEIHSENLTSIRLFTKLGFIEKSKVDDSFSSYDLTGLSTNSFNV